ncbi:uncharacterized protein LOC107786491 [Nicotiana tabacum]|uniref:Uncharacterized protein LOC107786491 n=1 Tax=Nicotiana tabacum TaxID=4097 RepID=A0A1S3ZGQ1_TOBAC
MEEGLRPTFCRSVSRGSRCTRGVNLVVTDTVAVGFMVRERRGGARVLEGSSLVFVPWSWRQTILVALSVRNKLDFIIGSSVKPPDSSPLARQWQRCIDLVVSWLTNSLSKDIAHSVEYSELAKDIWSELEERYSQADAAKIFELKKELTHISQGLLDIASYFNKIKQLWNEIDALSISRVRFCSNCDFKSNYQKDDDVRKAYQFLMGFNNMRSRGMSLPLLSFSYICLFQCWVSKQEFPSKVNFDAQRPLTFKYCKKSDHTIDKCYKLYGYAPNFMFTEGPSSRKTAAHV